jgi:hypothetical protein
MIEIVCQPDATLIGLIDELKPETDVPVKVGTPCARAVSRPLM